MSRRLLTGATALGVFCLLEAGCNCGPRISMGGGDDSGTAGDDGGGGSTNGSGGGDGEGSTDGGAGTGSGSGSGDDDGSTTTGGEDVPPHDGDDPSCGDGVPERGVYCFERVDTSVPLPLGVADFDGDTHVDILSREGSEFLIWFGDGNGSFPSNVRAPTQPPADPLGLKTLVGQMDGDAAPDIVVLKPLSDDEGSVTVFRNDGTGTGFDRAVQTTIGANLQDYERAALLDLDADGVSDLFAVNSGLAMWNPVFQPYLNDGVGGLIATSSTMSFDDFGTCSVYKLAALPPVGGLGDGLVALPGPCSVDNPLSAFPLTLARSSGAGDVNYSEGPLSGANPIALSTGDLDGDSLTDIALWNKDDAAFAFFRGDSTGGFGPGATLARSDLCPGCPCAECWAGGPQMFSLELDGDGHSDVLLWADDSWVGLDVLSNPKGYWIEATPLFFADFNEDGVDDLLTYRFDQTGLLLSNP